MIRISRCHGLYSGRGKKRVRDAWIYYVGDVCAGTTVREVYLYIKNMQKNSNKTFPTMKVISSACRSTWIHNVPVDIHLDPNDNKWKKVSWG